MGKGEFLEVFKNSQIRQIMNYEEILIKRFP